MVVLTANFLYCDFYELTEGVWVQDFPFYKHQTKRKFDEILESIPSNPSPNHSNLNLAKEVRMMMLMIYNFRFI